MMNLPSLRQLRYLVTVVDKRHFGQAAEACFITQSTLSASIKELEGLLGVTLLERTKRRVVPTPIGIEIASQAQEILLQAEDMVDTAQAAGNPLSGALRIGIVPTISPYLVPRFLPPLHKMFPDLKPYLREDQTSQLLKQLGAGELDVLILAYPYKASDVEHEEFMDDSFWVACPKDHPLAKRRKKSVSIDEVPDEELVLLEEGHCLRDHALAACHLQDSGSQKGFRGTSLETIMQMVGVGIGITLIPEMAVQSHLFDRLDISMIPLSKEASTRKIGLTWRNASRRKDEFRILAQALKEIMSKA
ncbi:MAG: hydrogen peroxide-inducible genes activator [Rhodospirillales bacterium]|nr:hydrogen peroxide-inducible genes activator [Rhodospirillales bacterium]